MKRLFQFLLWVIVIFGVGCACFYAGGFWQGRNHGRVAVMCYEFKESARKLQNPNRGFYQLFGCFVSDEEEDYKEFVNQRIQDDSELDLYLIQINLTNYRNGEISEAGLNNIENLFVALRAKEKQYIVRFLYDWDGKGPEAEPRELGIVLTHMRQLEDVLKEYQDIIFVQQGVFLGSYGEMHGSKFLSEENIQTLVQQLAHVTGEKTFLAVRTPIQWRKVTQISDPRKIMTDASFASRVSLYNDGMMGTEQDVGTYGLLGREEAGDWAAWNREDELSFQEELCKYVPNGGEVIIENAYNDFENAIDSMEKMHVTYLNQMYDLNVLNKWAGTIVSDGSIYDGMDGLSYIERHLGYRLCIVNVNASYDFWEDTMSVDIILKNVGFAPLYKDALLYLVVQHEESGMQRMYTMDGDIRQLTGGREHDEVLTLHKDISLDGYSEGSYKIYFYILDVDSGKHIQLANEQDETRYGYSIGEIKVETKEELLEFFKN